jgi:DNA-binding winged helix-turn-helix (wHTH) protein
LFFNALTLAKNLILSMKYKVLLLPPLAVLLIFFTVYASSKDDKKMPEETRYLTALRMIGHRLLLSAGDARSRVLPVKQLPGKKFEVHFENTVSLRPDSIFRIINETVRRSSLPGDYTAEVVDCTSNEIVYSFVISHIDSNIIVPCLGRTMPQGCYYISISFASSTPSIPGKAWIVAIALLSLSAWPLYSYLKKKRSASSEEEMTPVPKNVLSIGNFILHPDKRYLEIDDERIDLTDKESKLLHLLALSPNNTLDREKLQKEVWENEGVIVTRSLDVFISRLRKKLEKDPNARITNVHGKGYKLEIDA